MLADLLVHMAEQNVTDRLESIEAEIREIENRLEEIDRHLLTVIMWLEQIAKAKMS